MFGRLFLTAIIASALVAPALAIGTNAAPFRVRIEANAPALITVSADNVKRTVTLTPRNKTAEFEFARPSRVDYKMSCGNTEKSGGLPIDASVASVTIMINERCLVQFATTKT